MNVRACLCRSSLSFACLLSLTIGIIDVEGAIISFDDAPLGALAPGQYPGVSFSDGALVYSLAKNNNAISITKPLSIAFSKPQQRVKLWVGNPPGVATQVVGLLAYNTTKGGAPVASAYATVTTGTISVPLEVQRVLSADIVRVEVQSTDADLDDLEFEKSLALGTVTPYHFDFPDLVRTVISNQFDGVTFDTTPANQVMVDSVQVPTMSPPHALVTAAGEVSNPGFMCFWLDPPQGAVQLRVGNPWMPAGVQVTMRAYWLLPPFALPMLLATNQLAFSGYSGVTNVMEIDSWQSANIQYVEVEYSDNSWEAIDDLELAPNNPTPAPDTTPPVITQFAVNGQTGPLFLWRSSTSTNVAVSGAVTEDQGLQSVVVCAWNPGSSSTNSSTAAYAGGAGGNYTFTFSPVLITPGTNQVWAIATDSSGNASAPSAAITVVYDYPASSVTSVSPLAGAGSVGIRREGAYPSPNSGGITNLATNNIVTILGANLHQQVSAIVEVPQPGGGYIAYPIQITNRAPDLSSLIGVVPEGALALPGAYHMEVIDSWPGNYHTNWTGTYTVTTAYSYPKLWGFSFHNKAQNGPLDGEYWSCFGWNAYWGEGPLGIGGCCRSLLSWLFWPVYYGYSPRDGSCVGFAATSQLFYYDYDAAGVLSATAVNSGVYYPVGLVIDPLRRASDDWDSATSPSSPAGYQWPDCGPPYPSDLWGRIRANFAVQFSAEYLAARLDQTSFFSGGSFGRGDPAGRLADLRNHGAAGYILCFSPSSGGEGHAVVPYAVEGNRIWVCDNNRPHNWGFAPDHPGNQAATNSYIDIDPASNTFSFPNLDWTGDSLFAIPIRVWQNERHLPFSLEGIMNMLQGWFFGAADPLYSTSEGKNSLGWDKDGKFIDDLPGAQAINFYGSPNATRNMLVLLPTNSSAFNIQANVRSNANYGFLAAYNGRVAQCEALDAVGNETSLFKLTTAKDQLSSLSFQSPIEGVRFVPKLGRLDPKTKQESVFQWGGLSLKAGEGGEARFTDDPHAVELANAGSRPLRPLLVFDSNEDPQKITSLSFGPFEVPAGATLRVTLASLTAGPMAIAEVDPDGSGKYFPAGTFPGSDTRANMGSGPDCNNNGVVDSVDIALGTSRDLNGDGIPDECQNASAGPRLENWYLKPGNRLVFTLKGQANVTYVIEASVDLRKGWIPVCTNTAAQGTFEFVEPDPRQPGATRFYRARLGP